MTEETREIKQRTVLINFTLVSSTAFILDMILLSIYLLMHYRWMKGIWIFNQTNLTIRDIELIVFIYVPIRLIMQIVIDSLIARYYALSNQSVDNPNRFVKFAPLILLILFIVRNIFISFPGTPVLWHSDSALVWFIVAAVIMIVTFIFELVYSILSNPWKISVIDGKRNVHQSFVISTFSIRKLSAIAIIFLTYLERYGDLIEISNKIYIRAFSEFIGDAYYIFHSYFFIMLVVAIALYFSSSILFYVLVYLKMPKQSDIT